MIIETFFENDLTCTDFTLRKQHRIVGSMKFFFHKQSSLLFNLRYRKVGAIDIVQRRWVRDIYTTP